MVIGGLIRDNVTSTTSKVPFLGDIPILGWLFKSTTTSIDKANLMIFITPYIINNEDDAGDLVKQKNEEMDRWREEYRMEKKSSTMKPLPILNPQDRAGRMEPSVKSGNTGTVGENGGYPIPVAPAAGAVESVPTTTVIPAPAAGTVESVPTTTVSPAPAAGAVESVPTTSVSPAPAAGAVESVPTTSVSTAPAAGAAESAPTTSIPSAPAAPAEVGR
jgi:general secretion pathway protein D